MTVTEEIIRDFFFLQFQRCFLVSQDPYICYVMYVHTHMHMLEKCACVRVCVCETHTTLALRVRDRPVEEFSVMRLG